MTLTWRKLNSVLSQLKEDEVLDLLTQERAGQRRSAVLERLHQRYTALRAARERIEIMREAVKP